MWRQAKCRSSFIRGRQRYQRESTKGNHYGSAGFKGSIYHSMPVAGEQVQTRSNASMTRCGPSKAICSVFTTSRRLWPFSLNTSLKQDLLREDGVAHCQLELPKEASTNGWRAGTVTGYWSRWMSILHPGSDEARVWLGNLSESHLLGDPVLMTTI